jgi:hypothetical protein
MRRVLAHDRIIFASPIYWYAAAPAMKIFLDRISDFLDLPELLPEGRRLRNGGVLHANCCEGYVPAAHDPMAVEFAESVREASLGEATAHA